MKKSEIRNELAKIRNQIISDENGVTAIKNPEMEKVCQAIMEIEKDVCEPSDWTKFEDMSFAE